MVLTHAHIDHSGFLPRLFAEGYRGRVFCTPGTADLCRIVLPDAGRIAEEDAREANRHGYSKHSPALPLFTEADAYRALANLQPVGFDRPIPVTEGVSVRFVNSGHLLGSAFVVLGLDVDGGREVVFSGDVGRYDRPILPDPLPLAQRRRAARRIDLRRPRPRAGRRRRAPWPTSCPDTIARGGKLIIPAFAIGRVEEVIYWLKKLEEEGRIPVVARLPRQPDGARGAEALLRARERAGPGRQAGARPGLGLHDEALPGGHDAAAVGGADGSRIPAIVISSSGMATGGRVLTT